MSSKPIPSSALLPVAVLVLGSLLSLQSQAQTSVVRGAASVSSNMGVRASNLPLANVINQSGLSTPYTSGTTLFGAYTASTTHDSGTLSNLWNSASRSTTGVVTFDLGAIYTIDAIAVWNVGMFQSVGMRTFDLYADTDSNFANVNGLGTLIGSFAVAVNAPSGVSAQVGSFATAASTRYVHMQINSNNGSNFNTGFGEVVFSQQVAAVPEPATALMGLLGVAGVAAAVRRRAVPC